MDGGLFRDITGIIHKDAAIGDDLTEIDDRIFNCIASTSGEDRYGDTIAQDWDLADFWKNPALLLSHDGGLLPIGKVIDFKSLPMPGMKPPYDGDSMPMMSLAKAQLTPPGTHPMADLVHRLIKVNFLKGMSVGFMPGKSDQRLIEGKWKGGYNFTKNKLVELSVVAVPANPDAVLLARNFGAGPQELRTLFCAPKPAEPGITARMRRYQADLEKFRIRYGRSLGR